MHEIAGPAALAVVVLWIAYLVPHKLRHRQQLLEARADDRFSDALRVLAVTGPDGRSRRAYDDGVRAPDCGRVVDKSIGLLTPNRGVPLVAAGGRGGGRAVDRPHGTQDRISADAARRAAQQRAARAAAVARRGAAARRRGMLAALLLVASVAGWAVVGLSAVSVVAAVVPTVLLVAVVVLGRRAVLAGRAHDAEWAHHEREQSMAPARATAEAPAVTGRAVRPSEAHTEVFAAIVDEIATDATPAAPTATARATARAAKAVQEQDAWSPVPVPAPTYTLKASAPHREPAPLDHLEGSTNDRPAERAVPEPVRESAAPDGFTAPSSSPAPRPATGERTPLEPPAATTGSLDLDAILARRRAAGE
ncbi:hypothetical protein [Cellulomonas hominis]